MHLTNISFGFALVAAVVSASCATAAPQEAKRQPTFAVRDCVTYLRLFELQHRIIERETLKLGVLKEARAKQSVQSQEPAAPSESKRADQTKQSPSVAGAFDYDVEIGKLAFTIEKDRTVLTAIERRYNECVKTPPWSEAMAKAVPTSPPAAKKPETKRKRAAATSQPAPRAIPERPGPGSAGGGLGPIGIIGGGGVGIGF